MDVERGLDVRIERGREMESNLFWLVDCASTNLPPPFQSTLMEG